MRPSIPFAALGALLLLTLPAAAQESATAGSNGDRHSGYYYPAPTSEETYRARAQTLPDSDRTRRVGFVVELTQQILNNPYPPDFAIFAKGTEAEKLIMVAMRDGVIDTLFRARALLAMLTSVSRATPLFKEYGVADYFTFFDLLKILGFTQLTISDGESFAHQVIIE